MDWEAVTALKPFGASKFIMSSWSCFSTPAGFTQSTPITLQYKWANIKLVHHYHWELTDAIFKFVYGMCFYSHHSRIRFRGLLINPAVSVAISTQMIQLFEKGWHERTPPLHINLCTPSIRRDHIYGIFRKLFHINGNLALFNSNPKS